MKNKLRKLGLLLIIAGCTGGALYFAYRKGRIDEIEEIIDIVADQGEMKFTFKPYDKVSTILMQQL